MLESLWFGVCAVGPWGSPADYSWDRTAGSSISSLWSRAISHSGVSWPRILSR